METLRNSKAVMEYRPDGDRFVFSGKDLTDGFNIPSCYNRTYRGHKKAWEALKSAWTEDTTMYRACIILQNNKIKMHTYCAMD